MFLLGARGSESCVVCFESFEVTTHVVLDFLRVFVCVSQHCLYCTTPCLEAPRQTSLLLLLKALGLREIQIYDACYCYTCVSYILRVWLFCFYLLLSHQNPPWTWGFVCVVLGVGVISVFDAVAFLACTHRVSSPRIIITVPHHGKVPLIANYSTIELLHHSEAPSSCAHQSLMKWHDRHKYPSSYDNYSHGNYRPHLLRLLQCPDLELPLPQVYTSVQQLQLRNPQLNSISWSAHCSIKPHSFHP